MIQDRLAQVMQADRGRCLAALVARTGDFQRAEDALQEAAASALVHWGRAGVPASPTGWLLRAALRKAIDGYRRDASAQRHRAAMEALAVEEAAAPDPEAIPDDRLRLIFTCCHPALEEKTRIALTLRSLCGLTTAQVAAVFLDAEPTMGQRLSRARAKIAAARIPFVLPRPEDLPDRLNSVLTTVYLIFTAGYAQGPQTGSDLCDEAIFLARLLAQLAPDEPEVEAALALLLLTHARAPARTGAGGQTLPPARQDRRLWDPALLGEGEALLDQAVARRKPGPFQLKAAIAALHSAEDGPDWPQIAALYARLQDFEPTPVVALNHAVALAEAGHPAMALALVQRLSTELADYQPFHAVQADLLVRTGQFPDARRAYATAIRLAASGADRAFLQARLAALE
jgi:predicted RNA polymerase sigma factor